MYVKTLAYNYEDKKFKFKQFRIVSFDFKKLDTKTSLQILRTCNTFKAPDNYYNLDIVAISRFDQDVDWKVNPVDEDQIETWDLYEDYGNIEYCQFLGINV